MVLEISCKGTPYEIGEEHGKQAKEPISRCINFYAGQFKDVAGMEWDEVRDYAAKFEAIIRQNWPRYHQEMNGIAHGSNSDFLDIVALNVRTELMFGAHLTDGCTSLSWRTPNASLLAQNWDWNEAQKENLVLLTVEQPDRPTIKMVTEAGIIGKIGLNSAGVGVCLNAIKVRGMDSSRVPCHLGLRMALESRSREDAVQSLTQAGVASACFYLIADSQGGTGLEWSSSDVQQVNVNCEKQIFHTNHYIRDHPGVEVNSWLSDSPVRLQRVEQLCKELNEKATDKNIFRILEDEANYPSSICRAQEGESTFATLFSIAMDLTEKRARVKIGGPLAPTKEILLAF